jgi:hypothetical protein
VALFILYRLFRNTKNDSSEYDPTLLQIGKGPIIFWYEKPITEDQADTIKKCFAECGIHAQIMLYGLPLPQQIIQVPDGLRQLEPISKSLKEDKYNLSTLSKKLQDEERDYEGDHA